MMPDAFGLLRMSGKRLEQAYGQMPGIAVDYGGFVLNELGEQSVGEGDLRMLQHDHSQVFYGYCSRGLFLFRKVHYQLLLPGAQVGGVTKEQGAFDHGYKLIFSYVYNIA